MIKPIVIFIVVNLLIVEQMYIIHINDRVSKLCVVLNETVKVQNNVADELDYVNENKLGRIYNTNGSTRLH